MAGASSATPWGNVTSKVQDTNKGFFDPDSEVNSPTKSRSFKEVLSGSSGDTLPSLTQSTFNGVPAVLISDDDVLKLASPFHFTLVGKFGIRRPNLDAIRSFFGNLKLSGFYSVLHALGAIFGRPLQTDQATASRTRPSVARVLVEVDITKKHAKEVWVSSKAFGYLQKVEFEKVLDFCNHCKSHGHAISECFKLHPELKKVSNNSTGKVEIVSDTNNEIENLDPSNRVAPEMNLSNVEMVGNTSTTAPDDLLLLEKPLNISTEKELIVGKNVEDSEGNEEMEECEEGEIIIGKNLVALAKNSKGKIVHNISKHIEEEGSPKMNKKKKKNGKAPIPETLRSTRAQANTKVGRTPLWECLSDFAQHTTGPWCVGGDFNIISHAGERRGGNPPNVGAMDDFNDMISNCNLSNIGFSSSSFTWSRAKMWQRLDRILFNNEWISNFPSTQVHHLSRTLSDHAPLLMTISGNKIMPSLAFRFQNMWINHSDFLNVISANWHANVFPDNNVHGMSRLWAKLSRLKQLLRWWNKHVFKTIFDNIKEDEDNVLSHIPTSNVIPKLLNENDNFLLTKLPVEDEIWNIIHDMNVDSNISGLSINTDKSNFITDKSVNIGRSLYKFIIKIKSCLDFLLLVLQLIAVKLLSSKNFTNANLLAEYFGIANNGNVLSKRDRIVKWLKPVQSYIKLNIDGSVGKFSAGMGGIIRDSSGNPIAMFAGPLITDSVLTAELLGLAHGLEVCLRLGIQYVYIEIDSKLAIQAISDNTAPFPQDLPVLDPPPPLRGMISLDKLGLPYIRHFLYNPSISRVKDIAFKLKCIYTFLHVCFLYWYHAYLFVYCSLKLVVYISWLIVNGANWDIYLNVQYRLIEITVMLIVHCNILRLCFLDGYQAFRSWFHVNQGVCESVIEVLGHFICFYGNVLSVKAWKECRNSWSSAEIFGLQDGMLEGFYVNRNNWAFKEINGKFDLNRINMLFLFWVMSTHSPSFLPAMKNIFYFLLISFDLMTILTATVVKKDSNACAQLIARWNCSLNASQLAELSVSYLPFMVKGLLRLDQIGVPYVMS
ncbi:hypothetical protein KFK09_023707 [Dendrobium nobile]|uniref:RNase H type-1 domain-containing protein n=1 Tax=Dendrobium nobile TaxID=94219 RepID=A0A8T3ABT1_DENNO|nr:hypothetical protein KFK09_023707 [Dendrobium nobile]